MLYSSVDNAEVLDDYSSPVTSPLIFRNRQVLFLRRRLQVRSGRNRQRSRYHCFCTWNPVRSCFQTPSTVVLQTIIQMGYANPLDPCVRAAIPVILPVSDTVQRRNMTCHALYQVVVVCTGTLLALYLVGLLHKANQILSVYQYHTSETCRISVCQVLNTPCHIKRRFEGVITSCSHSVANSFQAPAVEYSHGPSQKHDERSRRCQYVMRQSCIISFCY